ncbi:MAG: PilZ domain-containing protein [Terriglobia bacterium]
MSSPMITHENHTASVAHRAPRYPIEAPIRFRGIHESGWQDGWTANVSRSGILFKCDHFVKTGTWVKMDLMLPAEILGGPGAEVECHGYIVRAEPPHGAQAEVMLAATISNYRFVREEKKARP